MKLSEMNTQQLAACLCKIAPALEHFNPRTPCGVRHRLVKRRKAAETFQSTHPVRGATGCERSRFRRGRFQSTHPVRGATELVR